MTPAARVQAAIEVLDQILEGAPVEKALTGWARRSRFAGSKDRAAVRDHVYDGLRRRNSAAALGGGLTGRGVMLGILRQDGVVLDEVFTGAAYAPPALEDHEVLTSEVTLVRDVPEWLIPLLEESLSGQLDAALEALAVRAPVILRVNLRKASVENARRLLKEDAILTQPMDLADTALQVSDGARRIRQSAVYLNGLVELQDASSQALVAEAPISNGMKVLDFCAGGGGKSLAMAGRVDAHFYAHDALPKRMADLPARAKRAGAKIQTVSDPSTAAPYDVVLCDVPCSGSGTWRRTPDAKWRFTSADLDQLIQTQAEILRSASGLVKEGGALIYATCSVLQAENQQQIAAFVKETSDWQVEWQRQFSLAEGGDGFFGAVLRQK